MPFLNGRINVFVWAGRLKETVDVSWVSMLTVFPRRECEVEMVCSTRGQTDTKGVGGGGQGRGAAL